MSDWQPIETAPKDGTTIDVYSVRHGGRVCNVRWVNEPTDDLLEPSLVQHGWKLRDGAPAPYSRFYQVTHWMPLPAPPSA